MPKHFLSYFVTAFISLYFNCVTEAQQQRPKIGLVLSGGGAKGLAHIGILKAMEKAGLRPDYITGTSMGSIIGGLYSIGYSATQIEEMVNQIQWDELLANSIRLNKIVMEEKPYYGRFLIELPTNNFRPKLPTGVIEGQNLDELLFDLTRRVHNISDFSKFPIPFACMAADITTGKLVVLDHGNLARSLRASMAIPAVFTPVEIDGKLLVDGGLVHNFPVDEVIKMGADIVIGVYLGGELHDKKNLKSLTTILFQSSFVTSAYDAREQMKKVDYYLVPDLAGFSSGSFSASAQIITQGVKKGEEFYPVFQKLADSLNNFGPQAPLVITPQPDKYLINNTEVTGNELLSSELITAKFHLQDSIYYSSKEIQDKISILYGRGYFENIGYQLYNQDSSGYKMIIQVKEAVPSKLKAAVHFDTENKAGVNINYTLRNKLGEGSRLIVEVDLAEFPRITANYLKYIGKKENMAVVGNILYSRFDPILRDDNNNKDVFSIHEYIFRASLITTYATNYNFGWDVSYSALTLKPESSTELLQEINYIKTRGISTRLYFRSDNLDRRYFPRSGSTSLVAMDYFFDPRGKVSAHIDTFFIISKYSNAPIKRVELMYQRVWPIFKHISVSGTTGLTFADHDSIGNFQTAGMVYFGGFQPRIRNSAPFYGSNNFEYETSSYLLGRLDIQAELIRRLYLTAGINYLNIRQPMEFLFEKYQQAGDLLDGETWRLGYGLSVGYMTLIGPISISAGMDNKKRVLIGNFSLGFYF